MTTPSTPTHYDTLGVTPDASADDIKRAYRTFSRHHHPDIAGPDEAGVFAAGTEAYTVLSDPDLRAAYDQSLANPAPDPVPDEPLDSWADVVDESWGDAEPVDAPVTDEAPPPYPQPGPAPAPGQAPPPAPEPPAPADTARVRVSDHVPNLTATTLVALTLPILIIAALTSLHLTWALAVWVVGGLVVGGLYGWARFEARRSRRPVPVASAPVSATWQACLGITAAAVVTALVAGMTKHPQWAWLAVPLLTGAAWAYLAGAGVLVRHANRRILPTKTLRSSSIFGVPPAGYASALLNQQLAAHLVSRPNARLFMVPDPGAFFTHAVVDGDRVVVLRAVGAPGGAYSWSGASLLHYDGGRYSVPLEGDYRGALERLRGVLGKRVDVTAAVVIVRQPGDPVAVNVPAQTVGYPTILDTATLGAVLTPGRHPHVIRRDLLTASIRALTPHH